MNGLLMTTEILCRYELFVNTSSDYMCRFNQFIDINARTSKYFH